MSAYTYINNICWKAWHEKIIGLIICLALVVILKNPISIGMMYVVDFIGNTFNITTVEVIDFLNEIYYF